MIVLRATILPKRCGHCESLDSFPAVVEVVLREAEEHDLTGALLHPIALVTCRSCGAKSPAPLTNIPQGGA
jgi:hypothetical protein